MSVIASDVSQSRWLHRQQQWTCPTLFRCVKCNNAHGPSGSDDRVRPRRRAPRLRAGCSKARSLSVRRHARGGGSRRATRDSTPPAHARAVALTDAGARYLERARRILLDVDEADDSARAERTEPTGRLVVSAPLVFGRLEVAPVFCSFLTRSVGGMNRVSMRRSWSWEIRTVDHRNGLTTFIAPYRRPCCRSFVHADGLDGRFAQEREPCVAEALVDVVRDQLWRCTGGGATGHRSRGRRSPRVGSVSGRGPSSAQLSRRTRRACDPRRRARGR